MSPCPCPHLLNSLPVCIELVRANRLRLRLGLLLMIMSYQVGGRSWQPPNKHEASTLGNGRRNYRNYPISVHELCCLIDWRRTLASYSPDCCWLNNTRLCPHRFHYGYLLLLKTQCLFLCISNYGNISKIYHIRW